MSAPTDTCDQCGHDFKILTFPPAWTLLRPVTITANGRKIGTIWVCAPCYGRLVVDGEPPAVGVRPTRKKKAPTATPTSRELR